MNMVLTQSLAGVAEYTVTLPPWSWHWDGMGWGGVLWRMDECGSDLEVDWRCRMYSDIASLELALGWGGGGGSVEDG